MTQVELKQAAVAEVTTNPSPIRPCRARVVPGDEAARGARPGDLGALRAATGAQTETHPAEPCADHDQS